MRISEIPNIENLSIEEKILLVEDLWELIAKDASNIGVPKSHINELEKRLTSHKNNPDKTLSFEELQEKIERQK